MSSANRLRFSLPDGGDPQTSGDGVALGRGVPFLQPVKMNDDDASGNRVSSDAAHRVAQLTDGQRDCLRLVYGHMTSKDIARALGVSPHTVDMRLRTAMRTLAVASRIEAARLLIEAESGPGGYQSLIYQASELADGAETDNLSAPASTASHEHAIHDSDMRIRPDDGPPAGAPPRLAGAPQLSKVDDWSHAGRPNLGRQPGSLAHALPWGERNELGVGARIAWISLIAIGSALGFGAVLGALQALAQLL